MGHITGSTRFIRDEEIVSKSLDGETVLVPVREKMGDLGSLYTLNPTATTIWELLDGRRDVAAIKSRIVKEFEVEETQAESDIISLLADLEKIGAVRRVGG